MGIAEETGTGVEAEPSQRPLRRSARPHPGSRERPGHGEGREVFGPSPPPAPDPLSIELRVWQTGPTALENERTPRGMREAIDKMKHTNPERRGTSIFFSEIETVFRHLDIDGDGKLELFEIYPFQNFISTRFGVENDGGNDSLLLRRFGLQTSQLLEKKDLPAKFIEDIDKAFSDPHNLLRTYDRDFDSALAFEEFRKALDDVAEGRGLSPEPLKPEPPKPPRPPEFPQLTGGLWEIDTGDYSGLAGLAVAAHDIIDPDDNFAGSFEDASIAWLFVAAGALILLAAGVWCARAQLARWNGHWMRGGLKTKAR